MIIVCGFPEASCVYFTQTNYTVTMPVKVIKETHLLDLFCYGEKTMKHSPLTEFHVTNVTKNEQQVNKNVFEVRHIAGSNQLRIFTANSQSYQTTGSIFAVFVVTVSSWVIFAGWRI
jgi:hypothetical protein